MDASHLKVPTLRIAVELAATGQPLRKVELFLAEHQDHGYRPGQLADVLESEQRFVAARDVVRDEIALFNKDAFVWVRVPLDDGELPVEEGGAAGPEASLYDSRRPVTVELIEGEPRLGVLLYSPPEGKPRVADHLNSASRFVRLWTDSHVYLINKRFVLRVVERGGDDQGAEA